jgi:hypothetical protein
MEFLTKNGFGYNLGKFSHTHLKPVLRFLNIFDEKFGETTTSFAKKIFEKNADFSPKNGKNRRKLRS